MKNFVLIAAVASLSAVGAYASPACATGNDSAPAVGNTFSLTGTCTVGGSIFSNFQVFEAVGPFPASFSVTIFVDPLGGIDIDYTGIVSPTDFHLSFQATPGIDGIILETGVGSTVSEGICGTAYNVNTGVSACGSNLLNQTILSTSNGGSVSSVVTNATTDFFYKDISGGSEVTQLVAPEPMTLSLMGAGLLGLGIFGRRRFTK